MKTPIHDSIVQDIVFRTQIGFAGRVYANHPSRTMALSDGVTDYYPDVIYQANDGSVTTIVEVETAESVSLASSVQWQTYSFLATTYGSDFQLVVPKGFGAKAQSLLGPGSAVIYTFESTLGGIIYRDFAAVGD